MTRVAVTGGRHYGNRELVEQTLQRMLRPGDLLITGGALGADSLAYGWAYKKRFPACVFPAPFNGIHDHDAGPLRNSWILEFGKPDIVIAFPGNNGTADMVRKARTAGIKVVEVS